MSGGLFDFEKSDKVANVSRREFFKIAAVSAAMAAGFLADAKFNASEGVKIGSATDSVGGSASVVAMCGVTLNCGGSGLCGASVNCGGGGQCGLGLDCSGGGGSCGVTLNCGGSGQCGVTLDCGGSGSCGVTLNCAGG
jgi:hypothetical protein